MSTLAASDTGVLLTDLEHVALACNSRFGEMFGIDHEKVVRSSALEVREMVRHRIANGTQWANNLELVYEQPLHIQQDELRLTNPPQYVRRYTAPVFGKNGAPIARLWTFQDVTDSVQRREMAELLEKIALMHDQDPRAVCSQVAETIGEYFGSVCSLLLIDGDDLRFIALGGPADQVRDLATVPTHITYCQFCIDRNGPYVVQDGRASETTRDLLPVQVGLTRYVGVPVHDPVGNVIGSFCIMDDRSYEVIHEEVVSFMGAVGIKLSAEIDRLHQLEVLQRDLDSTSKSLESAQRKLVESEKLAISGSLAATVAHDIRNILAAVSLVIENGQHTPGETLVTVKEQLDRFVLLANKLLSYSRPRDTSHVRLELSELIQRVASLLGVFGAQHRVEILYNVPSAPIVIRGEPGQLELALVNLMLNAVQAMPQGGSLTVSLTAGDSHAEIAVKDEGRGVSSSIRDRLFEPFSSTRSDGFGLGLYSCRRIAEDHGGSLSLLQTSSRGSTFVLSLPVQ